mgnify:FL=1|tara:strand:+ start:3814 stop:4092 length:279 start_codon:yes stop_codon:yes gene_type:complete
MLDWPHTPFEALPLAQQASILCNEPQFQKFAGIRCMGSEDELTATASAEYLRSVCRVASRRDLESAPLAAQRFTELHTEVDAWRGRIARTRT